ncbi:hypothetical protein ACWGJ2_26775 [Streptomyces sp. NPDC054796]
MTPESGHRSAHPEIDSWSQDSGGGVDYLDYAAQHLRLPDWLALARCFRPHFVEVSGCVIWDRAYEPDNFREWFEELNGDATSVEATLNEFRLWQVLDWDDGDPGEERRVQKFAQDLAFCWRSCLEADFPDKQFDGGVVDTDDGPVVRFVVRR